MNRSLFSGSNYVPISNNAKRIIQNQQNSKISDFDTKQPINNMLTNLFHLKQRQLKLFLKRFLIDDLDFEKAEQMIEQLKAIVVTQLQRANQCHSGCVMKINQRQSVVSPPKQQTVQYLELQEKDIQPKPKTKKLEDLIKKHKKRLQQILSDDEIPEVQQKKSHKIWNITLPSMTIKKPKQMKQSKLLNNTSESTFLRLRKESLKTCVVPDRSQSIKNSQTNPFFYFGNARQEKRQKYQNLKSQR